MSKATSCSKDFPGECEDCAEYYESYPRVDMMITGWYGRCFGPAYLIKKCKRFGWKAYEEIRG